MGNNDSKPQEWSQTPLDLDHTLSLKDMIERLPETRKKGGKYFLQELLKKEGADSVMAFLAQAVDAKGQPNNLARDSFSKSQRELLRGVGVSWPKSDRNYGTFYTLLTSGVCAFNAAKVITGVAPIVSEEGGLALGAGALASGLIADKLLQARIESVAKTIDDCVELSSNSGRTPSGRAAS